MLTQTFRIGIDTPVVNGNLQLPVLLSGYLELFNGFRGSQYVSKNPDVFYTNIPQFGQPPNPATVVSPIGPKDHQFLYDTKTIGYNPITYINGSNRTWQSWILEGFITTRKVHKVDLLYVPASFPNVPLTIETAMQFIGSMYFSKADEGGNYVGNELNLKNYYTTETFHEVDGKGPLNMTVPINMILEPKDAMYIEFSDFEGFYRELICTIHYENIK